MSRTATESLESALRYAARGWPVFPVHGIVNGRCTCGRTDCGSSGKHPLVRRGVHDAATDESVIHSWWNQCQLANVAIATGSPSGVVVIDIDLGPRKSSSGEVGEPVSASLDPLIELGLPRTLTSLTGGGGLHLLYACRDGRLGNSVGGLPGVGEELPGVDLRAEGGYVLVPPSRHISGRRYAWLEPEGPFVSAPPWLMQEVR